MPARTFSPDALRQIRRQRGVTQYKLAASLGVHNTAISHYENGHRRPDVETLATIADVLGARMDDFVTARAA
ncbi:MULTISPECIES: helix-turn-helix domain-containing protein [Streptomyces]|uniref:Transcriptional regulator n=1 Tax=Streptomyces coelicolor (strain ATCC BAA-471 / A3(2) / M145) TaxID=100226 RepID=O69899_STRCO|nr:MULTISPECIES: helix-turn-helix transcriptional regulator [Streptomyces]MDX2929611.1 helix-turn-helix transcriptional regulator [Streptomyces sp. NRRL_B-16638]MYU45134.1 helix-turn-helix domain-containing protein [Streptomyces sp. SID7813]NSL84814.1 helix-turn-helix transcriptional regulator [Streptomyces coelicolor]QFI45475.1 helix-turn-helix transcriptional regulator [Streptomyces coelicolor A3(2)]QKN69069.1 helix-turn-helix transcriptional regulator [Streptomyces coelicolor]